MSGSAAEGGRTAADPGRTARRPRRRAVRPGAGAVDPSVGLRADDDRDLGWQQPTEDPDDERLRREVPPHW